MKFRFSLRALLALVTIAVAFCVWRDRPRQIANQFVQAIEDKRFAEADVMLLEPDSSPPLLEPVQFEQFLNRDHRNRVHAERRPQSPEQWLRGECLVEVRLEDFDGLGATIFMNMRATARGVEHGRGVGSHAPVSYLPDPLFRRDIQVR